MGPLDPRRLLRHRHQSLCPGFRHMESRMHQVPGPLTQNVVGRAPPTLIILLGAHRTTGQSGQGHRLRTAPFHYEERERESSLSPWDLTGPSILHYMIM